jgi:DNA-binding MarR family transcriptional regulator
MVDRLAARGLVERKPDPADGRGLLVLLTGAGRVRQREIGRAHARSVARAVNSRLSRDELAQLEAICRKLAGQALQGGQAALQGGQPGRAGQAARDSNQPNGIARAGS